MCLIERKRGELQWWFKINLKSVPSATDKLKLTMFETKMKRLTIIQQKKFSNMKSMKDKTVIIEKKIKRKL